MRLRVRELGKSYASVSLESHRSCTASWPVFQQMQTCQMRENQ